jgi:hypothetical protein
LHGVGSMATSSGRVMLVSETTACPGANPATRFHSPLSMPLIDRLRHGMVQAPDMLIDTDYLLAVLSDQRVHGRSAVRK